VYRTLIVAPLTALLLTACVLVPADQDSGVLVAPALPLIVELGVEPYYYQRGYHYYYDNSHWRYSTSRSGPWSDLPSSHYPRETRFKGRGDDRGRDRGRDQGRDRGRDQDRDRGDRR
jgi:hypothetical protein